VHGGAGLTQHIAVIVGIDGVAGIELQRKVDEFHRLFQLAHLTSDHPQEMQRIGRIEKALEDFLIEPRCADHVIRPVTGHHR